MYEERKLDEARRFFALMKENRDDRAAFEDFLSAFLCAGRSVLQYAIEEERIKNGSKSTPWYDKWVKDNKVIAFFKGKRDANVHQDAPVKPQAHYDVNIHVRVGIAIAGERLSEGRNTVLPHDKIIDDNRTESNVRYTFIDWTEPESNDVFELCQKYIDELAKFIADGKQEGIITD